MSRMAFFEGGTAASWSCAMTGTRQVLWVLAGVAVVVAVALGFVPTSAESFVSGEDLNCGAVFVSTEWSLDDACEGPILSQSGYMASLVVVAVGCGVVALGVRFAHAYRAAGTAVTRSRL